MVPRRRREDSIIIGLKEIGASTRNWINSVQERDLLENPFECGIELLGCISHGGNYFMWYLWIPFINNISLYFPMSIILKIY